MQSYPFHPRRGPAEPVVRINFKAHNPPPRGPKPPRFKTHAPPDNNPAPGVVEPWQIPAPPEPRDARGIVALLTLCFLTLCIVTVAEYTLVYFLCVMILCILGFLLVRGKA